MVRKKQKQHYVPQFYLKHFSPEEDGSYVYCYDKEKRISFTASTRDICQEISFYDSKYSEKSVEGAFAIGERYCSTVLGKVVDANDLSVLSMEEFAGLLGFLLLLKQRTRKRRDIVGLARMIWMDKINEQFTDWKIVPESDDWQRKDHLSSMVDLHEEEGKRLFRNNWVLIINNTSIPFWTSDDPLVQQLVTADKRFKGSYLRNYCPITPKMLMFSEPLLSGNVKLMKISISDESIVTSLNKLTFNNAYRFVISNAEILLPL